jgi:hypothetical protein
MGLVKSAFGGSLELDGQFGKFGRIMASVAVKMFSGLI